MEAVVDGEDDKPVVYFENQSKALVLNKTNSNSLEELSGSDETDDWVGLRISLYATKVDFQGRRVPAIRIDAAPAKSSSPGNGGGNKAKTVEPAAEAESDSGEGERDPEEKAGDKFAWAKGV
jgi:hypothetical protein